MKENISITEVLIVLIILIFMAGAVLYCIAYTPEDSPLYKIRHKEPKNAVRAQGFNNAHYKLLHF